MPSLKIIFSSSLGIRKLKYSPKNADALKFMLSRDRTYKGINRKITDSFEFVKDGREYLRNLFYAEGIDAKLNIEIFLGNDSGWNSSTYLGSYKGDFSEFKINDTMASIKLLDGDFESKISSRQSTAMNINTLTAIDGELLTGDLLPIKTMSLHDRTVVFKNKHNPTKDTPLSQGIFFNISPLSRFIPMPLTALYKSNENVGDTVQYSFAGGAYPPEGIFLLNSTKDIQLTIKMNFATTYSIEVLNSVVNVEFRIVLLNKDTNTLKTVLYSQTLIMSGIDATASSTIVVDATYPILKGESLTFEIVLTSSPAGGGASVGNLASMTFTPESYIESENVDIFTATTPNVMLPHESGERILQLMTGVQTPLYAPIFGRADIGYPADGEWAYLGVFNGYMVRGFDYATKPINMSFKNWFEDYSSVLNLAAYIDKSKGYSRLIVDKLENILDTSVVGISIDSYQDMQVEPMSEDYFATLQFGYDEIVHEDTTGLDSFNGLIEYATPVGIVTGKLVKKGKAIADDYAIALAQRKPFVNFATEDTRYDEKNIFIDCGIAHGVIFSKRLEDFDSAVGILSPAQAYNLNISPMRNLLRHKRYLMVGLYRKLDKKLKFIKGARNANLVTKRTDETFTLAENQDIEINTLGTPYLLPYFINFKAKITAEQFAKINDNPNALIELTIDRIKTYGFIDEFEYNVMTGESEFKIMQSNR